MSVFRKDERIIVAESVVPTSGTDVRTCGQEIAMKVYEQNRDALVLVLNSECIGVQVPLAAIDLARHVFDHTQIVSVVVGCAPRMKEEKIVGLQIFEITHDGWSHMNGFKELGKEAAQQMMYTYAFEILQRVAPESAAGAA